MIQRIRKISISLCGLLAAFCGQCLAEEEELPSVMELQQRYVAANGGLANIQALSSLVINGVMTDTEGNQLEVRIYKKRPDLIRLQIDLQAGSILKVFDGTRGYELYSREGKKGKVVEMDATQSAHMQTDSAMDGPFFQLRSRPERLKVVAEVEVDGLPAYEVVVDAEAGSPYERIWLGKEHGQEVKLSRHLQGEGGTVVEEVYFSEFEQVEGVWFSKLARFIRDGELVQTVRIDRVRANVGVFDSYFKRPNP